VLPASRSTRTGALHAFDRALAGGGAPLVMLAWARYPSLDKGHLAGASPAIAGLLRKRLRFRGVIVTDALVTRSVRAVTTPERMAVASARAGADLLDTGENTPGWRPTLDALVRAAGHGDLPRAGIDASYGRVLALKRSLR
jgi:beta-glucosidase-like glycosyl hydrolase